MPLSDHEQRLLEQMERALSAEDPKLASALRGIDLRRRQRRRAIIGAVVFVIGLVLLFAGIIVSPGNVAVLVVVSILGFLIMLLSAYYVATSLRHMPAAGEIPKVIPLHGAGQGRSRRTRNKSGESFMARMEERWRRRRESGGF